MPLPRFGELHSAMSWTRYGIFALRTMALDVCDMELLALKCTGALTWLDTCIGYNSLYYVPKLEMPNGKGLPDGRRLWSWLILFDDGVLHAKAIMILVLT